MSKKISQTIDNKSYLSAILRIADTALISAQRLGEEVGHAPALEEDIAFANLGLDLLGQARLLYQHAQTLDPDGRNEDAFAFQREPHEFFNLTLAERPNADFAHIVVRHTLLAHWFRPTYAALAASEDESLAGVGTKAMKEIAYHCTYLDDWFVRLGDGTEESHRRMQSALNELWKFTHEMFEPDPVDLAGAASGIAPDPTLLASEWRERVNALLERATLAKPEDTAFRWHGKRGHHSEEFTHLIGEMQVLQRTYPGSRW